jgi:diadenosine tetraphosphate (Ap4A) HIT family hydrolase
MRSKNERVQLEMKIMKYRHIATLPTTDDETRQRMTALVAKLEQRLREIDE